jgi:hypothetical protein
MPYLDPNIKNFIQSVDSRVDKQMYKAERGQIRYHSDGYPRELSVHHIIPIKISSHLVVYHASRDGWNINSFEQNGLPLPANIKDSHLFNLPCHTRGGYRDHPKYTEQVAQILDEIEKEGNQNTWSDRRYRDELEKAIAKIIMAIGLMKGGQYLDEIELSSSSGCYIATATLTTGGSDAQLNILRAWRDRVMTATRFGRNLEAFYDKTGPTVASHVKHNQLLANSFLYPFVKPAIWLVEMRSQYPTFAILFDLAIYAVFLTGLAYGSIVYLLHPKQ